MISAQQIRAARGLLNMSQKDLAKKCGLSLNSLNNIERGVAHPRTESLDAVKVALEGEGIQFLENHGVCLKGERLEIEKIEGGHIRENFLKDFLSAMPTGPGEVLYMGIDNARFGYSSQKGPLDKDRVKFYRDVETELIRRGIHERLLFLDGDTKFMSSKNVYRWVKPEHFSRVPLVIYGDNIAIILWGPPERLVIIRNASVAETFRQQFEAIWALATPVPDAVYEKHRLSKKDFED